MGFSSFSEPWEGVKYPFGLDNASLSGALRRLADSIDTGDAVPQSVIASAKTESDNFVMETLTINYVHRLEDF